MIVGLAATGHAQSGGSCPSWGMCEAVPGPGNDKMFADWMQAELGIETPVTIPDIDADGAPDVPGSVLIDEDDVEAGTVVLGDDQAFYWMSKNPVNSCESCGLFAAIEEVAENATGAQQAAAWSGAQAGDSVGALELGGNSAVGTIGDVAQVDHGHGHTSWQMLVDIGQSSYLVVFAGGSAFVAQAP